MTTHYNKSYVKVVTSLSTFFLLKSPYRLNAFWKTMLPSIRTCFLFMSCTHKYNDLSILTKPYHILWP